MAINPSDLISQFLAEKGAGAFIPTMPVVTGGLPVKAKASPDEIRNAAIRRLYPDMDTAGATQAELELASGNYADKYDTDTVLQFGNAVKSLSEQKNAYRSPGTVVSDALTSVASGFAGSLASIPGAAVGLVAPQAGAAITQVTDGITEGLRNTQSAQLQNQIDQTQSTASIREAARDARYKADIENGESVSTATLRTLGREVLDSISGFGDNSNVFADKALNTVGSLGASIGAVGLAGKATSALKAATAGTSSLLRAEQVAQKATLANATTPEAIASAEAALQGTKEARLLNIGARKASNLLDKYSTGIGAGSIEGAGAYSQTVQQAMAIPHTVLMQNSPEYAALYNENLKTMDVVTAEREAKLQIAGDSAIIPALLTGAFSGAVVGLTPHVKPSAAIAPRTVGTLLKEGIGEATEEAGTGIVGQTAGNKSLQEYDPSINALKGVGTQAAEGAVLGFGSQAMMGSIPTAVGTAKQAGSAALDAISSIGSKREEALNEKVATGVQGQVDAAASALTSTTPQQPTTPEQDSAYEAELRELKKKYLDMDGPISPNYAVEAQALRDKYYPPQQPSVAQSINDSISGSSLSPEDQAKATKHVNDIVDVISSPTLDPTDPVDTTGWHPDVAAAVYSPDTTRLGALRNLAKVINTHSKTLNTATDDTVKNDAITAINQAKGMHEAILGSINEVLESSDASLLLNANIDPESIKALDDAKKAMSSFTSLPAFKKVNDVIAKLVKDTNGGETLANQMDKQTPEQATATANNIVSMATSMPGSVSEKAVITVLKHAKDNRIKLNDKQMAVLNFNNQIVKRIEEANAQATQDGSITAANRVSGNVLSDTTPPEGQGHMKSVNYYVSSVLSAMNSPRPDASIANTNMEKLANLAQLQINKVNALNESYKTKAGKTYQSVGADGTWYESKETIGVIPNKKNSVDLAHRVAYEAAAAVTAYNLLLETSPLLSDGGKVTPMSVPSLDTNLLGSVDEVVKRNHKDRNAVTTEPVVEAKVEPVQTVEPVVTTPVVANSIADRYSQLTDEQRDSAIAYLEKIQDPVITSDEDSDAADDAYMKRVLEVVDQQESTPSLDGTKTKGGVTLTTKASAQQHLPKDQAKSDQANKFIGIGKSGSSTDSYRKNWEEVRPSDANSKVYSKDDVIFVSVNGGVNSQSSFNSIKTMLQAVVKAGATIITDTKQNAERSYNSGERLVATMLSELGYSQEGNVWSKSKSTTNQGEANGLQEQKQNAQTTEEVTPVTTNSKEEIAFQKSIPSFVEKLVNKFTPNAPIEVTFVTDLPVGNTGIYFPGESRITLPTYKSSGITEYSEYVTEMRTTLAHEFGHHLQWAKFDEESADNKKAVIQAWLDDVKYVIANPTMDALIGRFGHPNYDTQDTVSSLTSSIETVSQNAISREDIRKRMVELYRDSTFTEGMSEAELDDAVNTAVVDQRRDARNLGDGTSKAEYRFSFPEWFANNMARYVETNVQPDAVHSEKAQSVWKNIIDALGEFFNYIKGSRLSPPNQTFVKWLGEANLIPTTLPSIEDQSYDLNEYTSAFDTIRKDLAKAALAPTKSEQAMIDAANSMAESAAAIAASLASNNQKTPSTPESTVKDYTAEATSLLEEQGIVEPDSDASASDKAVYYEELQSKVAELQEQDKVDSAKPANQWATNLANLVLPKANPFLKYFSIKSTSPIISEKGPASTVSSYLSVKKNVYGNNEEVKKSITDLYKQIESKLQTQLTTWGNGFYNKKVPTDTYADMLRKDPEGKGSKLLTSREHKAASVAVFDEDGNLTYHPLLVQSIIYSAVDTLLTRAQSPNVLRADDVADLLGILEDGVTQQQVNELNGSFSQRDFLDALASNIKLFLGVNYPSDVLQGLNDGVIHAIAGEVLAAMQDIGMVTVESKRILLEGDSSKDFIDLSRVSVNTEYALTSEDAASKVILMKGNEDVLSKALVPEKAVTHYVGDAVPKTPTTVERTHYNKLSKKQKKTAKAANKVEYYLNPTGLSFLKAVGLEQYIALFGEPIVEGRPYNKEHLASLEGQYASRSGAIRYLDSLITSVKAYSDSGSIKSIYDIPVRFAHGFTSVARLMMLGSFTPQSSKVVRNLVNTGWSTLDMTKGGAALNGKRAFDIAFAQATGVKVHKMNWDGITAAAEAIYEAYDPIVKILQEFQKNKDYQYNDNQLVSPAESDQYDITDLMAAFDDLGVKPNEHMFHALMEYARYQNMLEAGGDATKFRTSLYLEADGVTNGAAIASLMITTGDFTTEQIENLRRVGVNIGEKKSLADLTTPASQDLYEAPIPRARTVMQGVRSGSPVKQKVNKRTFTTLADAEAQFLMKDTVLALGMFTSDISIPESGSDVDIKRGASKGPLMKTVYGSGVRSNALALTEDMMKNIYARMSDALQRKNENPQLSDAEAYFPNALDPEKSFKEMNDRMNQLLSYQLEAYTDYDKNTLTYSSNKVSNPQKNIFTLSDYEAVKDFKFSTNSVNALVANTQYSMMDPLVKGINETLGNGVTDGVDNIRNAGKVISLISKYVFKDLHDKALAKSKENGNYKSDYLTPEQINKVYEDMFSIVPMFTNGTSQVTLYDKKVSTSADVIYATNLSGQYATYPAIAIPKVAPSSSIAKINISVGDAQIIVNFMQDGAIDDVVLIYDGVQMPLDKIGEYGVKLNKSTNEAVQFNVYRELERILTIALGSDFYKETLSKNDDFIEEMTNLLGEKFGIQLFPSKVLSTTSSYAIQADARQTAMSHVSRSIDQMASNPDGVFFDPAGLTNEQIEAIEAMTDVELVAYLNDLSKKAIFSESNKPNSKAQQTKTEPVQPVVSEPVSQLSAKDFYSQLAKNKIVSALMKVNKSIFDNTNVVFGNRSDVLAKAIQDGVVVEDPDNTNGFTTINADGSTTIYLLEMGSDPETAIHELVHAATFNNTLRYFNDDKTLSSESQIGVDNLITLANKFLSEENNVPSQLQNVLETLNDPGSSATDKAVALNEFTAYALSNKDIGTRLGSKSALTNLWKKVVEAIQQIIGVTTNMYGQVVFNALVVASEPSMANQSNALLYKLANPRPAISKLRDSIESKLLQYLNRDPANAELISQGNTPPAITEAIQAQYTIESAFGSMPAEEATTFQIISAAFATETHLDQAAKAKIGKLYTYVMSKLTADDLLPSISTGSIPNDYAIAERRLDALHSANGIPSFIALAMTNQEFQKALASIPVQEKYTPSGSGITARLEAWGNNLMDSLADRMSKQGNATNVQQALDSLMYNIVETASNEASMFERISTNGSSYMNQGNEYIKQQLTRLSNKGIALGSKMEASNNKWAKQASTYVDLISKMLNDEGAESLGLGMIRYANSVDKPNILTSFIRDISGRNRENANVYDLIKRTRSFAQQIRQAFREQVPNVLNSKFSQNPTKAQWAALQTTLGKTDIASLFMGMNVDTILDLLGSKKKQDAMIRSLEQQVSNAAIAKAKQLSNFMVTGIPGQMLLRNATAIADQLKVSEPVIDKLVSLYALQQTNPEHITVMVDLAKTEPEGIKFLLHYMKGQRADELSAIATHPNAKYNYYKGYLNRNSEDGRTVIVALDSDKADLTLRGYVRIGDYNGSRANIFNKSARGYYYAPVASRAAFEQGIAQNIHRTILGVDARTGLSMYGTAGMINIPPVVDKITNRAKHPSLANESVETLLPVFNELGEITAYEQSIDPVMLDQLNPDTNLANILGARQGRIFEELSAPEQNEVMVDNLYDMLQADLKKDAKRIKEYVDILDSKNLTKVQKDAIKLLTKETLEYADTKFDGKFLVRKDMLEDVIGRRSMSVGDVYTDMNDMSPAARQRIKHILVGIMGVGGYNKLVKSEQVVQAVVHVAKQNIIIRTMSVARDNIMNNLVQLRIRNVPWHSIIKGVPNKTNEIHTYAMNQVERAKLLATLQATDPKSYEAKVINRKLDVLSEQNKKMSIYPLIKAGEFSSITDVGMTANDVAIYDGKFDEWMEQQLAKLPPSLRTAAEYGYVSRNTALFKGMQKAVQYGDFVAKAILFDHLVQTGMSEAEALGEISDEFINYDRLSARGRSYLESIGLLWFYTFKLRSMKIALSMLRNNPLQVLLQGVLPDLPGTSGSIVTDNMAVKIVEGNALHTAGPGMLWNGLTSNPWLHLIR